MLATLDEKREVLNELIELDNSEKMQTLKEVEEASEME